MNKLILIALAAVAILGATSYLMMRKPALTAYPEEVVREFKAWCSTYHKFQSATDPDEVVYRLGVFYKNYLTIKHHSKSSTYTLAQNSMMDLTHEEFKKYYLGFKPNHKLQHRNDVVVNLKPANAIDWRQKGAVTPVKDQGQCGSCWAFSTTGSVESAHLIQVSKTQVLLSEQQLVDCSGSYGNQGCNGGLMDQAFEYIKAQGITTESAYPYEAVDQTCKTNKGAYMIKTYQDVPAGDTDSLMNSLNSQPISIAVDATNWQFYGGGVFSDCSDQLDHGVLAVGYDASNNWIVKNSWSSSWGENGYITLAPGNTCGLANAASYPSF